MIPDVGTPESPAQSILRLAGELSLGFVVWWAMARDYTLAILWTRLAMIRDRWGNAWQIATRSGRFTP